MMRKFLTILLPLIVPFLLYWVYLAFARRKAGAAGAPAPGWHEAPWVWIAGAGVALLLISLFVFGITRGVEPGTKLVPPTWVDGEIVPSHPAED